MSPRIALRPRRSAKVDRPYSIVTNGFVADLSVAQAMRKIAFDWLLEIFEDRASGVLRLQ
ncbi:hypothetical protein ACI3K4_22970 [Streptomyces sp. CSMPJR101]|uniref:hypothetical protein n=1 Tax=Streptomyces sp. CSMPJR101 TaxID=1279378 RepID=UPI003851E293